ncbi:hypothetical protein Tco_0298262, partial [Tanacetum coccineum]
PIPIGDGDGDVNRFPDGDGDGDGDEAEKRGWGWIDEDLRRVKRNYDIVVDMWWLSHLKQKFEERHEFGFCGCIPHG